MRFLMLRNVRGVQLHRAETTVEASMKRFRLSLRRLHDYACFEQVCVF